MLESKSADLAKVKVKVFVAVTELGSMTYALSLDGNLYIFDKDRKYIRHINTKLEEAYSCTTDGETLYCGGKDGHIKAINAKSLELSNSLVFP
jgi:hypothetical protein